MEKKDYGKKMIKKKHQPCIQHSLVIKIISYHKSQPPTDRLQTKSKQTKEKEKQPPEVLKVAVFIYLF